MDIESNPAKMANRDKKTDFRRKELSQFYSVPLRPKWARWILPQIHHKKWTAINHCFV